MQNRFEELLQSEDQHIRKLNQLVIEAVKEQELISEKLYEFEDKHPPFTSKVADKVASFGGSWKFIVSFAVVMVLWMTANAYLLSKPFDPFPFILLNLLLSTLAAIQAPVIMMSQNRKEEKDRQRAVNDYLINLKAEIEIRNMHLKLDLLMTDQMRTLFDMQKVQVELMEEIKKLMKEQHTR